MEPFDDALYISVTLDFRCDLRCVHCMIDQTKFELTPTSPNKLEAILERNKVTRKYRGIILTGAEVTLNKNLLTWVRDARAAGFERVRIQTHGMGLADPEFAEALVAAGVNEFFVSVIAGQAETHDRIAQRRGAFEKTLRGLANLERHDVLVMTNTVVTELSYRELGEVARVLGGFRRLRKLEFWNYWPMAQSDDQGLMASVLDIQPHLREAIEICGAHGKRAVVKNFPACLLGPHADAVQNDQPSLVIDPRFYDTFRLNRFGQCPHRERCASTQCQGLTGAYMTKYGDHADELVPLPRPSLRQAAEG